MRTPHTYAIIYCCLDRRSAEYGKQKKEFYFPHGEHFLLPPDATSAQGMNSMRWYVVCVDDICWSWQYSRSVVLIFNTYIRTAYVLRYAYVRIDLVNRIIVGKRNNCFTCLRIEDLGYPTKRPFQLQDSSANKREEVSPSSWVTCGWNPAMRKLHHVGSHLGDVPLRSLPPPVTRNRYRNPFPRKYVPQIRNCSSCSSSQCAVRIFGKRSHEDETWDKWLTPTSSFRLSSYLENCCSCAGRFSVMNVIVMPWRDLIKTRD